MKTGVFTIKIKEVEFIVKRTEKKEIVSSKYGTVKHKIKWISECKYILFNRRPKFNGIKSDIKIEHLNEQNVDTIYNDVVENNEREFKILSSDKNSNVTVEYIYKKDNYR
ncbi:hypothetical protein [Flavobacterium sp.]|uniref:hypothetical protein n=1 Tax=Flavobacterium sp. TaxID=239 RepID=UPI0028BEB8E5|nr:hypothetical protein [Flavobacterium sp.]